MNNTVATQFENIDKLYKSIPSKGTAVMAEENGPLNNVINSMVNTGAANSRFEFIDTLLKRSDNPYSLGALMLDQNKFNSLPDPVKIIFADILSKLLNYKDQNNVEATIRADIDYNLMENANRINYNDINFIDSGDKIADIKALLTACNSLGMSKPLLNDSTGMNTSGPVLDMLLILKTSGNMVAYNLALEMLNKLETFALVKKVLGKAVAIAKDLQFSSPNLMSPAAIGNVAVNQNLIASAGNGVMSIDGMIGNMTNILVNSVNPITQRNLPQMYPMISYLSQSIPTLLPLDIVKTFNALTTLDDNTPISAQDKAAIEASYGKFKAIYGPDCQITVDLKMVISLGYLAIKLMEFVQVSNGKVDPNVLNGIVQYIGVLNMIAYGRDASNVQPEKLALVDAVVADIQSGKPFFTLGLYGGNSLIANAAKTLFVINPSTGIPLLNSKNIIESSGVAYTGGNAPVQGGINFIMVRTFLEKIPQLKPYISNVQQLDELAQAIRSALVRLNLNV